MSDGAAFFWALCGLVGIVVVAIWLWTIHPLLMILPVFWLICMAIAGREKLRREGRDE